MLNLDFSKEFIEEWKNRADKMGDGPNVCLSKFFCYFIAFNYLYFTYGVNNSNLKEDDVSMKGERKMIGGLLRYLEKNKLYEDKSPYDLLDKDCELLSVVRSNKSNLKEDDVKRFMNNLKTRNINQLFQNIYTVRCNLFHGSKSMMVYRNSKLVKESNIILKDLLNRVLETYPD